MKKTFLLLIWFATCLCRAELVPMQSEQNIAPAPRFEPIHPVPSERTPAPFPENSPDRFLSERIAVPVTPAQMMLRAGLVAFPPYPPPLGDPPPVTFNPRRTSPVASLDLSADAYETFSTALSVLFIKTGLSTEKRNRLENYHRQRSDLLATLRDHLGALSAADPHTRERELAAFAIIQAPAIAGLETEAERLRAIFTRTIEPVGGRFWRNPDQSVHWSSPLTASKALRSDAAFQGGLSVAQRLLLREFEMAVNTSSTTETFTPPPDSILFFSPATARIHLPSPLPAELSTIIAAYSTEKNALLTELSAMLETQDKRFFSFSRTRALRALAERQGARFTGLEQLAEEIRRGLASIPSFTQSSAPPAGQPAPTSHEEDSFDQLLAKFPRSQETLDKFQDYRAAVLEPGLSPGQRRLLFGAGLAPLNLPFNH